MSDHTSLAHLASRLGFSIAELELNRATQLSPEQGWLAFQCAVESLGMMLGAAGSLLVVLAARVPGVLRALLCVFLIPACVAVLLLSHAAFAGAVERRVATAEGLAQLRRASRRPTRLIVGGASVPSPPNAKEVLTSPRGYRLYYLAGANEFLSIEPL